MHTHFAQEWGIIYRVVCGYRPLSHYESWGCVCVYSYRKQNNKIVNYLTNKENTFDFGISVDEIYSVLEEVVVSNK